MLGRKGSASILFANAYDLDVYIKFLMPSSQANCASIVRFPAVDLFVGCTFVSRMCRSSGSRGQARRSRMEPAAVPQPSQVPSQ